jgi:hypothetical protein
MKSAKSSDSEQQSGGVAGPDLDRRYGKIGISAVAAALRYGCDNKNPAYAPSVPQSGDSERDAAA